MRTSPEGTNGGVPSDPSDDELGEDVRAIIARGDPPGTYNFPDRIISAAEFFALTRNIFPPPEPPRFPLVEFDRIRPDVGAVYLIKGLLPGAGLALIWGEPKCGKSFWTFDALMSVALGWDYRGHRVTPGAVVYCALEGAHGFKNRIEAFKQAKLSEADSGSPPFYLMAAPLEPRRRRRRLCRRDPRAARRQATRCGLHRYPQPFDRRL